VLRTRLAAVSFCAAALTVPLPQAHAVLVPWHTVTVTSGMFTPSELYVTEGDSLFLVNADPTMEEHNIVATDPGTPFSSGNIAFGGRGEVTGVATLAPSRYPFVCTIHDVMLGNLNVLPLDPTG
jgi:plastocyanin